MKNIKWSVYEGDRYVDSGSCLGESDSEVLRRILARDLGDFSPVPEKCYRVTAGGSTASTYGDEFERTCHAVGDPKGLAGVAPIEERALSGGYLYDEPELKRVWINDTEITIKPPPGGWNNPRANPLKDIQDAVRAMDPCSVDGHDMNGDTIRPDGMVYPTCRKCGLVSDAHCREATGEEMATERRKKLMKAMRMGGTYGMGGKAFQEAIDRAAEMERRKALEQVLARNPNQDILDPDRAREDAQMEQQIGTLVNSGTIHPDEGRRLLRGLSGGATLPEINPSDLDGGCYGPDDHRLIEHHDAVVGTTTYACSRCGKLYMMMTDQQILQGSFDVERVVRNALGDCR